MNLDTKIRANTNNVAIILANTAGLGSAFNDVRNLGILFRDHLSFNHTIVVSDSDKVEHSETHFFVKGKLQLLGQLASVISGNKNSNIVVVVSSHGYCEKGDKNFIIFGGEKVTDDELHSAIVDSLHTSTTCLIDACQSATFLNLNYQTTDLKSFKDENSSLKSNKNIISISACSTSQYDQDDISDLGYDGGLSSGFIDCVLNKIDKNPTIGEFFRYIQDRLKPTGNTPVLSFNDKAII